MRHLSWVLLALSTLLIFRVADAGKQVTDPWIPLFNGRDLTGWKTHPSQPGNWRVVNGILTGSGQETSHIYSTRGDFKDFHLRAETRINHEGNGGVFVRASFGPVPLDTRPGGYEAQINSTDDNPKTGSLFTNNRPVIVVKDTPIRPGEWFLLEVIAQGDRIVVKVDGQTTADYLDEAQQFKSGHIVLQQWLAQTLTEFRRIEIRGPGITAIAQQEPAVKKTQIAGILPQEQEMLQLINKFRADNDLPPCKINPTMLQVARQHSENMARQNKLDHVLDEKGPGDRVRDAGLRGGFGENIAGGGRGAPAFFFQLWVDSPGHKANMLGDYAEMGVGFATSADGTTHWYTTVFGGRQ